MTWVLVGIVLAMSLVVMYQISRMGVVFMNAGKHLPRDAWERVSARAMIAMGLWQLSIATYLGYTTSWTGSITLYGAGLFLGFVGWYQRRTWTQ